MGIPERYVREANEQNDHLMIELIQKPVIRQPMIQRTHAVDAHHDEEEERLCETGTIPDRHSNEREKPKDVDET